MGQVSYSDLFIYFTLYSVLGWICESIWCSIGGKKLVNRGFLTGPWCPIYGFGAIFILLVVEPLKSYPILAFFVGLIVASMLEYFVGWLLETLFQTRWWDYSNRKFNLRGRVCLRNSLIFGVLGLIVVYGINPEFQNLIYPISSEHRRLVASLLFVIIGTDAIRTIVELTGLRERMAKAKDMQEDLEKLQKEYGWFDIYNISESINHLEKIAKEKQDTNLITVLNQIETIRSRKGSGFRLIDAFPDMKVKDYAIEFESLRKEWKTQRKSKEIQLKEELKRFFADVKEDVKVTYKDITFTKIVWVFTTASVLGYVVETIFCILKNGVFESRQGLIYGPFSHVYGFGAIVLLLLLAPYIKKSNLSLFIGGMIVGGLFETVCSLISEAVFGSVSWDYSNGPFSLFGGRTNLLYMFFWGALSIAYIRIFYPKVDRMVKNMEPRPKKFFTSAITIFLAFDMLISAGAVARWSERLQDIPATNVIEEFFDKNYTNDMLEEIYPNMQFRLD